MAERLYPYIQDHTRFFVITGAGCSTDSGIPDYRDQQGKWKRKQPIFYQSFINSLDARRHYWARSYVGWIPFSQAQPNQAHKAFAELEEQGYIEQLVTQNVDGLHQKAGSKRVIDLHGRLESLICLKCGKSESRAWMQERLQALNPNFISLTVSIAPDGDSDLEVDCSQFQIQACPSCGGVLKPDVVFYGEQVPKDRVEKAYQALHNSDIVLVAGTSLMVFSAFQFVREAAKSGKTILAINQGRTRADDLIETKVEASVSETLKTLLGQLPAHRLE